MPGDAVVLPDLLERGPAQRPCLTLTTSGRRYTYGDLAGFAREIAGLLLSVGISRGDVVALVAWNGPECLATFFGAATVGAAVAPINPQLSPEEVDRTVQDANARAVLVTEETAKTTKGCQALPAAFGLLSVEEGSRITVQPAAAARLVPRRPPSPEDDALILFTSGTTSRPKRVPLTHRNLLAAAAGVARSYALTEEDVTLGVMPFFHVHGLVASALATLVAGGQMAVQPRFSAGAFWPDVEAHRPTWYTAVPTVHRLTLEGTSETGGTPRHQLRFVRSCSSELPPALQAALESALGVPVLQAYGMTEASHQIATNPLPPGTRKPGSVGLPVGVEVTVLGDDGCPLAAGAEGEVALRGPTVTRGYLDNPAAYAEAFANGWFRTGDLGSVDRDGYLFLLGRIKEFINRGGEKISPYEVEEALLRHPAVREAVAIAVPHPLYGEEVEAVVALHPGATATPEQLMDACRGHLAPFKCPKAVRLVPQIPRSATGKVQRRRLPELL